MRTLRFGSFKALPLRIGKSLLHFCGFMENVHPLSLCALSLANSSPHPQPVQARAYLCTSSSNFFCPDSSYYRSSAIIEDIDGISGAWSRFIAFYFFDFEDPSTQTLRSLLSSLIIQLCHQSDCFLDFLQTLYSNHKEGTQSPTVDALTKCLNDMLKASGRAPIYLIFDAVDECSDIDGPPSSRNRVLSFVEDLIRLNLPALHLCITSRPEIDIWTSFVSLTLPSNRISLHEQSGQKRDIAYYVREMVKSEQNMQNWPDEDKELVIKTLSERADGM
jgi:hypothetical protein